MSDRGRPWRGAVDPCPGFFLMVSRTARPPLPWTWEICREADAASSQRSAGAYRSAEDAWAAGRSALTEKGREGDPSR